MTKGNKTPDPPDDDDQDQDTQAEDLVALETKIKDMALEIKDMQVFAKTVLRAAMKSTAAVDAVIADLKTCKSEALQALCDGAFEAAAEGLDKAAMKVKTEFGEGIKEVIRKAEWPFKDTIDAAKATSAALKETTKALKSAVHGITLRMIFEVFFLGAGGAGAVWLIHHFLK